MQMQLQRKPDAVYRVLADVMEVELEQFVATVIRFLAHLYGVAVRCSACSRTRGLIAPLRAGEINGRLLGPAEAETPGLAIPNARPS